MRIETRSKNAYEIRASLLNLAFDVAMQQRNAKYEAWRLTGKQNHDGQLDQCDPDLFESLEDDVLSIAKKFYDFVGKNTSEK